MGFVLLKVLAEGLELVKVVIVLHNLERSSNFLHALPLSLTWEDGKTGFWQA